MYNGVLFCAEILWYVLPNIDVTAKPTLSNAHGMSTIIEVFVSLSRVVYPKSNSCLANILVEIAMQNLRVLVSNQKTTSFSLRLKKTYVRIWYLVRVKETPNDIVIKLGTYPTYCVQKLSFFIKKILTKKYLLLWYPTGVFWKAVSQYACHK